MNCTICGKPIKLVPSAKERARKYGGTARQYDELFTEHAECLIDKRQKETKELMRKWASTQVSRTISL
jgi:hypothetical protein